MPAVTEPADLQVYDLISRTRRYLMSGNNDERNQLADEFGSNATTMTFTYPMRGISAGARISIGLDTFYVWSVEGNTATVSNDEQGTSTDIHEVGETVLVRPKFTDYDVLLAINEAINELSAAGLFQMKTFDFTYSTTIDGYDLTNITDLQEVYEIRYQEPGPYKDWPRIPNHEWVLMRDMLTTDFASGNAIRVTRGGWPGYDIRLQYKTPFSASLQNLTDSLAGVTGLALSMNDLPPLGAAIKLMSGREIKRNFTEAQGDTRRATEVPPGAILNSSRGLQLLYQQRLTQELARLHVMWPSRVD